LDQSHYDAISFFSEISPCGVIGSFVLDRLKSQKDIFLFKHHFITNTLDSDIMLALLNAIHEKRSISVFNYNRKGTVSTRIQLVPLKIYISTQNGRQYLMAYQLGYGNIRAFRLDFLYQVKMGERFADYDQLMDQFEKKQNKIWGVNIVDMPGGQENLETVEMILKIEKDEKYILERLNREKRGGIFTEIDSENGLYRYFAEVYDTKEMIPWIRTLLCRIVKITFSNKDLQKDFEINLKKMYDMYGIGNEDET
jgi:predicted DNA-binding transcriptional regulator YafY